jgi:hypothetical protein
MLLMGLCKMYTFEIQEEDNSILLIFSGKHQGTDFDYGESLEKTLKGFTEIHHLIIFLTPSYLRENIDILIGQNGKFVSNLSRHEHTPVLFFSFNEYGLLSQFNSMHSAANLGLSNDSLQKAIVRHGINQLASIRAHSLILTAPPGTIFSKPSGGTFTEFIKASELAIGCSENQFIAFCLLTLRPTSVVTKRIFIDSNSIASYAVAVLNYLSEFNGTHLCDLDYQSFNSYEGLEENEPDYKGDIWVIISASSSNGLGKTVLTTWKGTAHEQIVTLLSYRDTLIGDDGKEVGVGDKIVTNISAYSSAPKKVADNLIPIQIIGENFHVQIDPPELVVLKKHHLPDAAKDFLIQTSSVELFVLNKSHGNKTRNIYFDSQTFLNTYADQFFDWLKSAIIWNVPFGIKFVIFESTDPAASAIFTAIEKLLPSNLIVIDCANIQQHEFGDCSVLVLAPVISTGRLFLKVNRDLRMADHTGPRLFACILSLFKSKKVFGIFEKSLTQARGDYKYKFLSYKTMFVGENKNTHVWLDELKVVEAFVKNPLLQTRAQCLRDVPVGMPKGIGFSSGNFPLQFNKDFAFWNKDYNPNDIIHASVYVSIACALQNLRDKPSCEPDSLYHHVYKHAVIDPENFSRLNEGVIQASLWRAAEKAETNYSHLQDVSEDFVAILVNLATEIQRGATNALADLLLGVATEKIQLHEQALTQIVTKIKALTIKDLAVQEIISYIQRVLVDGKDPLDLDEVF